MTKSNYFKLDISIGKYNTKIEMVMLVNILSTGKLPFTCQMLETYCPGVLLTRCFNDGNLPFKEEVKDTEIAHLFEHILLQNLYQIKTSQGYRNVIYKGDTSWNWKLEKRGLFHIYLSANKKDMDIFEEALEKTIVLVNRIIDSYFYYPGEFQYTQSYSTKTPQSLKKIEVPEAISS